MRYQVTFRREARDEALEAAAYIAEHGSLDAATRWYAALEQTVASLSEMPRRFAPARESDLFPGVDLRQAVVMSHRVVFAVRDDEVHVLHVRHTARLNLGQL